MILYIFVKKILKRNFWMGWT